MNIRLVVALVIALVWGPHGTALQSGALPHVFAHGADAGSPTDSALDGSDPQTTTSTSTASSDGGVAAVHVGQAHVDAPIVCTGDGTSGNRVQAMYVRPSDRPDRFLASLSTIAKGAADVEATVNGSAAKTGGVRHVRWVTDESCRLNVVNVTMTPEDVSTWSNFKAAMVDHGFDEWNRKYMVWVDGSGVRGDGSPIGGVAKVYDDDRATSSNLNNGHWRGQVARIDLHAWHDRLIASHEFGHILGAVQRSAPNGDTAEHHCSDEYDRMCYDDDFSDDVVMRLECAVQSELFFDCNNDDYFHTNPPAGSYLATHWNTADSSFLQASPEQPANDDFDDAIEINPVTTGAWQVTSNRGAGRQRLEPLAGPTAAGHTVWFRWTAPSSETVVVDTKGSTFDTAVAVYTGTSVGSLTMVASNDNAPNSWSLDSHARFFATSGTTYRIAVDGAGTSSKTGAVVLGLGRPHAYDEASTAHALGPHGTGFSNTFATRTPGEPSHGGPGGASMWFTFTAPSAGIFTFTTEGSHIDTLLGAYTASMQPLASNDNASTATTSSKVSVSAAAGQKLYLAVDGKHRAVGHVELTWSQTRQPTRGF